MLCISLLLSIAMTLISKLAINYYFHEILSESYTFVFVSFTLTFAVQKKFCLNIKQLRIIKTKFISQILLFGFSIQNSYKIHNISSLKKYIKAKSLKELSVLRKHSSQQVICPGDGSL